jgi:hypothetical protein
MVAKRRLCVVCGARVTAMNPKANKCRDCYKGDNEKQDAAMFHRAAKRSMVVDLGGKVVTKENEE